MKAPKFNWTRLVGSLKKKQDEKSVASAEPKQSAHPQTGFETYAMEHAKRMCSAFGIDIKR